MNRRTYLTPLVLAATLAACHADDAAPTGPTMIPTAAAPARAALETSIHPRAGERVPGRYLVMLRPNGAGLMSIQAEHVQGVVDAHAGRVVATYASAVNGFAAELPPAAVEALKADASVLAVEPDQYLEERGTQTSAPWDLDRLDQQSLPLDGTYNYPNDGSGVAIYIVDSGINYTNADFGGRAMLGKDFVTSGGNGLDCKGHGTAVASLAGSNTYGVAKGATLYAVKVSDCNVSATFSTIISALDWVTQQKQANPSRPAVVNLSIGGGLSAMADSALARLIRAGVTISAAGGNGAADACTSWPTDFRPAIGVGGMQSGDKWLPSSDTGPCIDVIAPASGVPALQINPFGGTSAATPIVAGVAALYLKAHPTATPAQVESAIINGAAVGKLSGVPSNTANRLINVQFIGGTTPPTTNQPPTATISAPASGASFVQGASVTFTGSANDPESGALSGASLVWTSSINGQIGTGTSFSTSALSVGTHTITLTAKDPQGATGTATRTITITAAGGGSSTFAITPSNPTIAASQSITLTASGGSVPSGAQVIWRTSDATVATVGQTSGVVTGLKAGKVTIFATAQVSGYPTTSTSVTVH